LRFTIGVLFGVIWLTSCGRSPSYLKFINQDPAYHAEIADGCEELRGKPIAGSGDGRKVTIDDQLLPSKLKELHADYYRVSTNRVFISIGVGRGSYGIAWQPAETDTGEPVRKEGSEVWELRTYAEGLEKVLFTKAIR